MDRLIDGEAFDVVNYKVQRQGIRIIETMR